MFGGYGGFGYARHEFGDLFRLDINSLVWELIAAKGTPPERRSGHEASAVQGKLLIYGGSNSSTQFCDLHLLDPAGE